MRYEIVQNKLLQKSLSIFDDSGNLQFKVTGNQSICDPSGAELIAIQRHPLGRQVDIIANGELVSSVHVAGLGVGNNYSVDGPAGQLSAAGDFFGHSYTLTVPSGQAIATVSKQPGFREKFDVDIAAEQDDVLLLAVIVAIEAIHDRKGTRHITP